VKTDAHIARAAVMAAMGHEPEAKAYLRHLAISSLRHARSLLRAPYGDSVGNRMRGEEVRVEGLAYARASRLYRGGSLAPAAAELPYWNQVRNPHWPDLDSHGVYVVVHEYKGSKRPGYCVEIQILPGDGNRTQCCLNRRINDLVTAEVFAKKWIAIGEAVLAATVEMNTHTTTEER
jgi:hypothetical protein